MPRIAIISGSLQPDKCGVAHYITRLADGLVADGAAVTVLTDRIGALSTTHSFGVLGAIEKWSLSAVPRLVRWVLRLGPDVVHIQHSPPSFGYRRGQLLLPLVLRLAGWRGPVVVTMHEYGMWDVKSRFVPEPLIRYVGRLTESKGWCDRESLFLLTLSSSIVVTNDSHYEAIATKMPTLSSKLVKIPIGPNVTLAPCDQFEVRERLQKQFGILPTDQIAVFFGFLHPIKGLETLLNAAKHLANKHVPLRILVLGGQESLSFQGDEARTYAHHLVDQARDLGISDRVVFTGYLPATDVSEILQVADLCVLPFNQGVTLKSGSLIAALAHGIPTVATRAEAPDQRLVHRQNVYLVPARDSNRLADGMLQVLSSRELQRALRQGAIELSKDFSWDRITREHLRIYENTLHRP